MLPSGRWMLERIDAAEAGIETAERQARIDPRRIACAACLLDVVLADVHAALERVRAADPREVVQELDLGRLAAGAGPVDERALEDAGRAAAELVGTRVFRVREVENVARESAGDLVDEAARDHPFVPDGQPLLIREPDARRPAHRTRRRVDDVVDQIVSEGVAVSPEERLMAG